ncbi:olfactory receptor 52N5-like [Ictalurus punctatus]|uniref:Olfactory receptor 52N5-like n=1 Tax=Ictalurus punctatus TaxID=7998 RepID=A0A9F7R6W0_ICTPU|nr:olfactory receptor 52N5-like [Ictalurus punctatus]
MLTSNWGSGAEVATLTSDECSAVYISIIVFNTAVIFVIFMNKRLHEPMYIFIAALLLSQLPLCKFKMNRIYCDGYSIVKLSCTGTSVINLFGLAIFSIAIFPPVIFIIYSYTRILAVCLKNSKDFRRKALQTFEYLLIPSLFNPIIYGLKLQEILKSIKRLISWKKRAEIYF